MFVFLQTYAKLNVLCEFSKQSGEFSKQSAHILLVGYMKLCKDIIQRMHFIAQQTICNFKATLPGYLFSSALCDNSVQCCFVVKIRYKSVIMPPKKRNSQLRKARSSACKNAYSVEEFQLPPAEHILPTEEHIFTPEWEPTPEEPIFTPEWEPLPEEPIFTPEEEILHEENSFESEEEPQPSTSTGVFHQSSFYGAASRYVPRWASHFFDEDNNDSSSENEESSSANSSLDDSVSSNDEASTEDEAPSNDESSMDDEEPSAPLQQESQEDKRRHGARRKTYHRRQQLLANNPILQEMQERGRGGDRSLGIGMMNLDALVHDLNTYNQGCEDCGEPLSYEARRHHLDSYIVGKCTNCSKSHGTEPKRHKDKNIFQATTGIVSTLLDTGGGYADLCKLTSKLSLGGLLHSTIFEKYKKTVCEETKDLNTNMEGIAAECVGNYYNNELNIQRDEDGILDVDVSYDGTWMTRGHTSKLSAGFVIEADTGIVLDHECLSSHCHRCDKLKSKYKNNPETLQAQMQTHRESGNCQCTYQGQTSGGMEKEMAVAMWNRSINKNAMRYSTMIGDGDASTYQAICDNCEYSVQKEECVNHVSKRLGTRLRKLKKDVATEVRTATGRIIRKSTLGGKGKLTDQAIDKLGGYYGKAIRDNKGGSTDAMRNACLSGFRHVTSSDDNPTHELCPEGDQSWCFYNKARALGQEPPSHDNMKLRMNLTSEEKEKVKGVYDSLTTDQLLNKCKKGRTQNANESIHSKLWSKRPKRKFCGLESLKQAADATTIEHNFGIEASNVSAKMFPTKTKGKEEADKQRESSRKRMSLRKKFSKKKRIHRDNDDNDYGAGQH